MGVNITGQRGQKPHDIHRTAGAIEPGTAFVASIGFQRIGIEKLAAVHSHARQKAIVQGSFQHIDIFRIAVQQKQAMVPEHISDGGAGFIISLQIWQLVIIAKCFAIASCANSSSDVEFFGNDIIPDFIDGMNIIIIPG